MGRTDVVETKVLVDCHGGVDLVDVLAEHELLDELHGERVEEELGEGGVEVRSIEHLARGVQVAAISAKLATVHLLQVPNVLLPEKLTMD